MSAHSDEIDRLVENAYSYFTGKIMPDHQQETYTKRLEKYDIKSIKAAIDTLIDTHEYRNMPLVSEMLRIIQDDYDKRQHGFVVRTPQFMVYLGHPRSKDEMTRYLRMPETKRQAYTAILEWNKLTEIEREERWDDIGLGKEKTTENLARVSALFAKVAAGMDSEEMVKCCLCKKPIKKMASVSDYLVYYDPQSKQGVGEYACSEHMKEILNNAGYDV